MSTAESRKRARARAAEAGAHASASKLSEAHGALGRYIYVTPTKMAGGAGVPRQLHAARAQGTAGGVRDELTAGKRKTQRPC
jgi:hypothetical protein